MFLVIDAGNTRIKYGCHDGVQWRVRAVLDERGLCLPDKFIPRRVVVSSVAGAEREAVLQEVLAPWQKQVEWLRASAERCALRCDYEAPQKLGSDRWAAAIAAWQLLRTSCLVVSAGTATTIDVVREPGVYEGGCILPGLSMMLASLATGTARLPMAEGRLQLPARNTHDAIYSGCVLAQIGAIREMAARLSPGCPVLVTGGAADALLPALESGRHEPWLVLDGLLAIARDAPLST